MPVNARISSAVANDARETPISLRTRLFTSSWVVARMTHATNRLGSRLDATMSVFPAISRG